MPGYKYPYLQVGLSIGRYEESNISAYIDTGFEGYLVVPEEYTEKLGFPPFITDWEVADGAIIATAEYLGTVQIPEIGFSVDARITCLGSEFLIGRGVIDNLRVVLDRGQQVIIEALM